MSTAVGFYPPSEQVIQLSTCKVRYVSTPIRYLQDQDFSGYKSSQKLTNTYSLYEASEIA